MAGSHAKYQARVEDCPDDDEVAIAAARKSPSANVKAKRSNDLGPDKPSAPERPAPSAASDSGYSSHTAATMSSADSAPRPPSQSPPQQPIVADRTPKPPSSPASKASKASKGHPTSDGRRKTSSQTSSQTVQNSSRRPLQRSTSVSSRQKQRAERPPEVQDCTDPTCKQCAPLPSSRGRRPSVRDSALDVSYPFDQRSQRSDPTTYAPRSSTAAYTRQTAPYMQGPALVQPATTQRRRSSSQSRPRPMSYSGGDPGPGYWVPGMPQQYPPVAPQERGPPPSISAFHNMPPPPHPSQMQKPYTHSMLGATPPNNGSYFPQGHAMQTSPPYDGQRRPPLHARTSSQQTAQYNARRPNSQYGPAVITQSIDPQFSARFAPTGPQSARGTQYSPNEPSDEDSEEYTSEEELYNNQALTRPGARRSATTQVYDARYDARYDAGLAQSLTLPDRSRLERDPRAPRVANNVLSRSTSQSRRPPLVQHPKSVSYEAPGNARVVVESARDRRRQSYMGHEPQFELEDKHRRTMYPMEAVPRRRRTDADTRRGEQDYDAKLRRAQEKAEAHQRAMRGAEVPLTEHTLKAARRSSKVITGTSETGSSRHSDKASRVSQSRTAVTNGNGGEIRLRVDASAPINIDFNGDAEGRTISFNPTNGGMADIVIGSSRSESTYPSERGSLQGVPQRKAITNGRREVEDSSVKSRKSNRSAREEERRPLRRRQGMYND